MIDTSGTFLRSGAGDADLELELANRCFMFALLSRAFGKEPDDGFCGLLSSGHARSAFELYEGRFAWAREVVRVLDGFRTDASDGFGALGAGLPAARLSQLEAEYTYLFLGPGKLPAPLWESVYVTGRNEVCTEETLAVRQAYRINGFSTDGFPFVAEDHIAVELAFMASLSKSAFDASEREAFERAADAQDRFLDDHLNRWVKSFAERMLAQRATGMLYPALAAFAAQLCLGMRGKRQACR